MKKPKKLKTQSNLTRIALAQFRGKVDLFGLKETNDIQDQYGFFLVTSPSKIHLYDVVDLFLKKGCSIIEYKEGSFTLRNPKQGMFRAIDCSFRTGDLVLDSIIPYKLYDKTGKHLE